MTTISIGPRSIFAAPEFGSQTDGHRLKLRKAIYAHVIEKSKADQIAIPENIDSILDLASPPRLNGWAISLSHNPAMGGFVAYSSQAHCGIDFEIKSRVSRDVGRRIAAFDQEKDFIDKLESEKQSAAYIWGAKEAAIKAFGNLQPNARPHAGAVELVLFEFDAATSTGSFAATYSEQTANGILFAVPHFEDVVGAFAETVTLSKF